VLGGETKVVSLTNPIKLKIPAGTHSGQIFRLKGKGIAKPNGSGYGDQLVKVNIEIPKQLTYRQKNLLEEFSAISGETINSHKKTCLER
jgi:molecular chaperone DnaJ|tara:strand:+ start:493 stop:759 length:267 start_codon:yes stop_codon:yes gene_type:complete